MAPPFLVTQQAHLFVELISRPAAKFSWPIKPLALEMPLGGGGCTDNLGPDIGVVRMSISKEHPHIPMTTDGGDLRGSQPELEQPRNGFMT